ncbi:hypothetical protein RJ639_040761 [Escallonia herrerae]|uniref:C3H1-type domain-containing protein n=1 Tax=Escallonia herrerae TaxID=1293975 RepID=A0AA88WH22_9ASTE|nr:hypothetical protein RJ639_040761 [Escallonia herrerae]
MSHCENQYFKKPITSEGISYKTQPCLKLKRGICSNGDSCKYLHDIGEIQRRLKNRQENWDENPRRVCSTKTCGWFSFAQDCPYGDRCIFLHGSVTGTGGDLELSRKSCARNTVAPVCDKLGRSVNWEGPSAKPAYQKKTRLCFMWENTGTCQYGLNCDYAHGQAEVQKLGSHTVLVPGSIFTSEIAAAPENASSTETGLGTSYKQQQQGLGKESLFKCGEDWANLIVDLANASIGSTHFLRRGSSRGKSSRMSSEARMTVFTALTRRTCSAILSRFLAPSMSLRLRASTAGITVPEGFGMRLALQRRMSFLTSLLTERQAKTTAIDIVGGDFLDIVELVEHVVEAWHGPVIDNGICNGTWV